MTPARSLRIAFLLRSFPGLSITFILDQITGLLDRGHTVDVFAAVRDEHPLAHPEVARYKLLDRTTYYREPDPTVLKAYLGGVPVLLRCLRRSPVQTLRSLNVLRYGRHALSLRLLYGVESLGSVPRDYDIIHGHFGPAGIRGALFRELGIFSGRLVASFYGYDVSQYPRLHGDDVYTKHLFRHADLLLVLSNTMREELIALGSPPEQTKVHHIGTDPEAYPAEDTRRSPGQPARILTVARLADKKGLEYAIRAVAGIQDSSTYDIVGDGPLRPSLEALIRELGQQNRIVLHGWMDRPAVASLLLRSDIFLHPSVVTASGDQEGTPTAIMEASAAGMPVVATHHAGIPEVVQHGITGLLVPERDVTSLRAALLVLVKDVERRIQMGHAGRDHIKTEFNVNLLNDRLVEHYARVLEDSDE